MRNVIQKYDEKQITEISLTLKASANAVEPSFSRRPLPEINTFNARGLPAAELDL